MINWKYKSARAVYHFEGANGYIAVNAGKKGEWVGRIEFPVKKHSVSRKFKIKDKNLSIQEAAKKMEPDFKRELNAALDKSDPISRPEVLKAVHEFESACDAKKKSAALDFEDSDALSSPKYYVVPAGVPETKPAKEKRTIVLIAGPSGSGKTTLANMLDCVGYRKITTCTTRPAREGERNGVEYHFFSDDEFETKKESGFFLETASYRGWKYGTPAKFPDENCCIVLTPAGIRKAVKKYPEAAVVFLRPDRKTCLMRMLKRGDDIDEACRRSSTDVGQFDAFEEEADFVLEGDMDESSACERVIAFLEGFDPDEKAKNADLSGKIDEIYRIISGR